MDKKDLLQFDLFAGLRDDALDRFLNTARVSSHTYPAGCLIFLQGTECDALHLLLKGSAKATMNNTEGKKIIIEQIQAPCILAPAALFASNSNYPVNIEANETCVIAFIQKSDFADLMQRESSVMQAFIRILADKSIFLSQKVNGFALQNLRGRLASYLLNHEHIGTQQEIADYLGVARPSMARVLSEFVEKGYVSMEGRRIVVSDRHGLLSLVRG